MLDCHLIFRVVQPLVFSSTGISRDYLAVKKVNSCGIQHNLAKYQKVALVDWFRQMLKKYISDVSKTNITL